MAHTEQQVLEGLAEIVNEVAGVPAEDVTPFRTSTFWAATTRRRFSMAEVVIAAEERFDVKIPDDDVQEPQDAGRIRRLHPLASELTPARCSGR